MVYYYVSLTVGEQSKIYNNRHETVPYFANLSHSKNENKNKWVNNKNMDKVQC
jgi:hypothetical protein